MSTTTKDKIDQLKTDFEFLEDWEDKYNYIIDLGKGLQEMPAAYKVAQNLIKGCQSNVWLWAERKDDDTIEFFAESDAIITKGLIALLLKVYNHMPTYEVSTADWSFIADLGLQEHLSPSRANGLNAMMGKIKLFGEIYNK